MYPVAGLLRARDQHEMTLPSSKPGESAASLSPGTSGHLRIKTFNFRLSNKRPLIERLFVCLKKFTFGGPGGT